MSDAELGERFMRLQSGEVRSHIREHFPGGRPFLDRIGGTGSASEDGAPIGAREQRRRGLVAALD
jgi:hypothetical protein